MARARSHKRRRTRSRRRVRHNPVFRMTRSNPRRRRRYRAKARRHHYRRNPPAIRPIMNDILYAGIGYMGTKFAVGAVLPSIGIAASPPSLTGIAAKLGTAYGVAWLGEKFIGGDKFKPIFIGGVVSAIQDFVTLYIAPSVPALAGPYDLGAYYRPAMMAPPSRKMLPAPGMGAYVDQSLGAEDMVF